MVNYIKKYLKYKLKYLQLIGGQKIMKGGFILMDINKEYFFNPKEKDIKYIEDITQQDYGKKNYATLEAILFNMLFKIENLKQTEFKRFIGNMEYSDGSYKLTRDDYEHIIENLHKYMVDPNLDSRKCVTILKLVRLISQKRLARNEGKTDTSDSHVIIQKKWEEAFKTLDMDKKILYDKIKKEKAKQEKEKQEKEKRDKIEEEKKREIIKKRKENYLKILEKTTQEQAKQKQAKKKQAKQVALDDDELIKEAILKAEEEKEAARLKAEEEAKEAARLKTEEKARFEFEEKISKEAKIKKLNRKEAEEIYKMWKIMGTDEEYKQQFPGPEISQEEPIPIEPELVDYIMNSEFMNLFFIYGEFFEEVEKDALKDTFEKIKTADLEEAIKEVEQQEFTFLGDYLKQLKAHIEQFKFNDIQLRRLREGAEGKTNKGMYTSLNILYNIRYVIVSYGKDDRLWRIFLHYAKEELYKVQLGFIENIKDIYKRKLDPLSQKTFLLYIEQTLYFFITNNEVKVSPDDLQKIEDISEIIIHHILTKNTDMKIFIMESALNEIGKHIKKNIYPANPDVFKLIINKLDTILQYMIQENTFFEQQKKEIFSQYYMIWEEIRAQVVIEGKEIPLITIEQFQNIKKVRDIILTHDLGIVWNAFFKKVYRLS